MAASHVDPPEASAGSIARGLVWAALAAGLVEGTVWAVAGRLPASQWGTLLGVASLAFPIAVLPPVGLALLALAGLARVPGGCPLRHPWPRAVAAFVFFALSLPLGLTWNARHPGFALAPTYLLPYAAVGMASALVALAAAWLAHRRPGVHSAGVLRGLRVAVAIALLVCAAQATWACLGVSSAPPPPRVGPDRRPDVVLISVDTLRRDRLGSYGYAKTTDPEIQRAFADGLLFRDAVSLVSLTRPSHASMLTGRHPLELGMRWNERPLPEDVPTLAEILRQNGYTTAGFVSGYPLEAAGSRLDRGFDHYSDAFNLFGRIHPDTQHLTLPNLLRVAGVLDTRQRRADAVTDDVLGWLASAPDTPLFLFVHYYDPHTHYHPPGEYAREMGLSERGPSTSRWLFSRFESGERSVAPQEARDLDALYDGEVRFADAQLGRLFDALRRRGSWDRTVLLLTADHGEVILERLASDGRAMLHSEWVDEEEIRVPFLMRGPGVPVGARSDVSVATYDVLPTLLGRVGIAAPPGVTGRDLLAGDVASLAQRPVVTVNSPRNGRGPTLVTARAEGFRYTRELETGREWIAAVEGVDAAPAGLTPELLARLREAVSGLSVPGERAPLDPEVEANLRALGYAE
jgi:arylsulfatase A-like enzyme